MKQHELSSLEDEKLVWMFVEPIISKTRGKAPNLKAQVYMSLNSGQRALFMFQVMYGHAGNGIFQFFSHISYLTPRLDLWSALKSAMQYFNDTDMLGLVEKMEIAYSDQLSQAQNVPSLEELNQSYCELIPQTLKRIGAFLRNNPDEFSLSVSVQPDVQG